MGNTRWPYPVCQPPKETPAPLCGTGTLRAERRGTGCYLTEAGDGVQRPFQTGSRFSANATAPSIWSSEL